MCTGLITTSLLQTNIEQIEENLNLNISSLVYENVTIETVDVAAKMFLYLNFCPDAKFLLFLEDLFKTASLQNMLLSLTSITKTSQNAVQKSSSLILNMLLEKFELCNFQMINDLNEVSNGVLDSSYCKKKLKDRSSGNNLSGVHHKLLKDYVLDDFTSLLKVTNHPVHIQDDDGELSPTALIPFCDFGGDMSAMGVKIDQFDVPVCNSFKAQIIQDQLCYSLDPNKFRDNLSSKNDLELSLLIDYNEDRIFKENVGHKTREKTKSLKVSENKKDFITINTLGDKSYTSLYLKSNLYFQNL